VVYGVAGNSSAVFPLQRLGREVWAINTVEFSNHTGYGAWKGDVLRPGLVDELVAGIAERGVLGRCEAVLSGYLGDPETAASVHNAVKKVKSAAPQALYCCDPVMGDVGGGFYVKDGIFEFFRDSLIADADIITPNQFELNALTGVEKTSRIDAARKAIDCLHQKGPRIVLVTSYRGEDAAPNSIEMLVSDGKSAARVRTPELKFNAIIAGTGDLTTAVFLSRYMESGDPKTALEMTAASVYGVIAATHKAGSAELLTVQAQQELVSPAHSFKATTI
jgi:pyridoxine kinase